MPAGGTALDPGSIPLALNPLGKIPCLERPDGPALYDSRVICRYLDDLAGGRLYPGEPRLWETLTLEATADGIAEAMLAIVYEARLRPEEHRRAEIVEAQWAKVARALDAIEARWMAYLAGPFDAGQAALGCALGYLDLRGADRDWRAGRPGLAAWEARVGGAAVAGGDTAGLSRLASVPGRIYPRHRDGGPIMDKFTKLTGVAAPLPLINVDTDMIIPKQFLKTIQRSGLGKNLFDEMRYDADGNEVEDFVLNKPAYRKATILVAGENFGCGSSREHAPWALLDFGIRCVIAPSFADIFYNNCFKNGILPIALPQEEVDKLMDDAERGANAIVTIDLENQVITGPDGGSIGFEVDAFRKHCLLNGLDDIGLTMEKAEAIDAFEAAYRAREPWHVSARP